MRLLLITRFLNNPHMEIVRSIEKLSQGNRIDLRNRREKNMETRFDNLGLTIGFRNQDAYCAISYDIYGHGDFAKCSKAVAEYAIRKIRKFPAESWRKTDKLIWNMINHLI